MPKSSESINKDLEDLLVAKGYDVTPLDSSGKDVPISDSADLLSFHFHKDGKDYGTVMATIDGLQKLTLYYDDEIANSGSAADDKSGTSWISLVKQLKKFAQQHQLGFVLKDTDRLRQDMKRRSHQQKLEESAELKRIKREYNQTAKNKGGDYPGVGKKIDNQKKSLRHKDIGKVAEDDAGDVEQRFAAKMEKEKQRLAKLKQTDPAAYKREMEKRKTSSRIPPVSTFEAQGVAEAGNKPLEKSRFGMGDPRTPRDIKSQMRGASDRFVQSTADKDTGPIHSRVAKMQTKMAKSELRKRSDHDRMATGTNEGVAEGLGKSIKRASQGWGVGAAPDMVTPSGAVSAFKNMDGQRLANFVASRKDQSKPRKNSAGAFVDKVIDREMRQRGYGRVANKDEQGVATNSQKLDEGYYGNKKMSYSDDTPTVKMVIKHNRQLEETDQRFRHIDKIFLETSDGERFSVPTNKPSRARMFARHIAEGGAYKDDRWSHLNEICEDLDKLGGFVRATHNKREQFNESAQRMINEAQEQYQQLRETVKKLSSSRGYNKYFESYEPRVILEDDTDLAEAFMHSSIDTRIESALPTLSKFGIKMGKINESDMFAEWADSLVSEALDPEGPRQVEDLIELLSDVIPVGPNAEVAIGELRDVIEDDELYNRLRRTAKADPDSDARPQIIAWMQEQDDENYRRALDKIEADDGDSEKDQAELKKGNQGDAEEPAKVKPKKQPQPGAQSAGGLPPLPPLPGGDAGGLPPLPPLPPLKEGDEALASFKRLLGR